LADAEERNEVSEVENPANQEAENSPIASVASSAESSESQASPANSAHTEMGQIADDEASVADSQSQRKRKRNRDQMPNNTENIVNEQENNCSSASSSEESESEEENDSIANTNQYIKPPPFIITDFNMDTEDFKRILNRKGIYNLKFKISYRSLKVQVEDIPTFRKMQRYLDNNNFSYHTYALRSEKPLKAVFKNLPASFPVDDIILDLEEKGFREFKVDQMTSRRTGEIRKLPIFVVTIPNTPNNKKIFQITHIMYYKITVENYVKKPGATMCHNCQGFFHISSQCHHPPRCVKCSLGHKSSSCGPNPVIRCVNCGQGHVASHPECPANPRNRQREQIQDRLQQRRQNLPGMSNRRRHPSGQRTGVPRQGGGGTYADMVRQRRETAIVDPPQTTTTGHTRPAPTESNAGIT